MHSIYKDFKNLNFISYQIKEIFFTHLSWASYNPKGSSSNLSYRDTTEVNLTYEKSLDAKYATDSICVFAYK